SSAAWPLDAFRDALGGLAAIMDADIHDSGGYPKLDDLPDVVTASSATLYPWNDGPGVPIRERRSCLVDRPSIERVLLQTPRDLAALVTRAATQSPNLPVAKMVADVSVVVAKRGSLLLVATREPRSRQDARLPP